LIKDHLFHIVILLLAVTMAIISISYKDNTEAMVAVVEPQVTAISYRKAVIVEKIHVIPGQEVQNGQLIIEVIRPDLHLDLEKLATELSRVEIELETLKSQYHQQKELAKIEYESEHYQLKSKIEQEQMAIEQNKRLVAGLDELTEQNLQNDSIGEMQVQVLENQLKNLEARYRQDQERESIQYQKNQAIQEKQLVLASKELAATQIETDELVRYALGPGTVGAVDVRLGELIPPFQTLITIYESQPSMIRAFMNEEISYEVEVGDQVWVESENRLYKVSGKVVEIGSRITSFPKKINSNPLQTRYGQEVYVQISENSRFLNGEKVFVYPVASQ